MKYLFLVLFLLLAAPAEAEERQLCVVSDINNTIRENGAVQGMPEIYRRLAERGAMFHYVSYSGKGEEQEIEGFISEHNFPQGEIHLRADNATGSPAAVKGPMIEAVIDASPKCDFILIGDSGMEDPEMYGNIARKYRQQIRRTYIRNITEEKREAPRFEAAFKNVPPARWILFTDPATIDAH